MKFLRRKVQRSETMTGEGRLIHREIEITVEREWLSVPSGASRDGGVHDDGATSHEDMPVVDLPVFPKLE